MKFPKLKTLIASPQPEIEDLLTPREVKGLLKCSLPYIYKLAEREILPPVRYPSFGEKRKEGPLRFKKRDVFNFIEANYKGNN